MRRVNGKHYKELVNNPSNDKRKPLRLPNKPLSAQTIMMGLLRTTLSPAFGPVPRRLSEDTKMNAKSGGS